MQGNVVSAARWLGTSIIVASIVLVGGMYWVLSVHTAQLVEAIHSQAPDGPTRVGNPDAGSRQILNEWKDLLSSLANRLGQRYSTDPNLRIKQLLNESEDLRTIEAEWERIWRTDQPSHLTPERVHGGIE